MPSPATYDAFKVKTTALTTTPVQISAPAGLVGKVVMVRLQGDAAWSYSDASSGTYVSVAANTPVDFPFFDPHTKVWVKASTTANLVSAFFTSGT